MKWPIGSIVGIIIVPLAWIFILISFSFYPSYFSPFLNYMSDLGNYIYNPNGAIYYNIGNIINGCLTITFFLGLYLFYSENKTDKRLLFLLQVIGLFSGFSLIMTAVYSEDLGDIHMSWSISFFITSVFCSLIGGIYLLRQPDSIKGVAHYNIFLAFLHIVLLLLILPFNLFILEWVISFTGQINLILVSLNYAHIFKERKKKLN